MTRIAAACIAVILVAACTPALSVPPGSRTPVASSPSGSARPSALVARPSVATSPTALPSSSKAVPALLGPLPVKARDKTSAASLQNVLDGVVAGGAPDVIAAVITKDGAWTGAAGIDGPSGRVATVQDEFALASISKTFIASLVMRLAEQGKIDLDAPLASYLGKLHVDANEATVREALGMRAGLAETSPSISDQCASNPTRVWTTGEIVASFDPPIAKPGTRVIYSNPTFKLLRLAAEHAAGMPFEVLVREMLLAPAKADRIVVQGPGRTTPKPWALPLADHTQGDPIAVFGTGGVLPCLADATFSIGNVMASDARSLAAWGWHLFAGDIVGPASLQQMMEGDGLGLERSYSVGGAIAYGHGGTKPGYGSVLVVLPDVQAVAVVFINDADADVSKVAVRLLKSATAP